MAFTANTPTLSTLDVAKRGARTIVNATSDDVTGQEELIAAPGAGKYIYLTHITLQSDDADAHPYLQSASDTLLGPLFTTAEGTYFSRDFPDDAVVRLAANEALNIDAAQAGNVWAYIEAYVDQ